MLGYQNCEMKDSYHVPFFGDFGRRWLMTTLCHHHD